MGGNALSYVTVRLTKENYVRTASACVDRLQAAFPSNRVAAIEAYRGKADFGDLDVLVESTGFDPYKAAAALDAVEVVRNGPVTSVGVLVRPELPACDGNVFQIDFITIEPASFDYAFQYFRMNDAGNLVGRVAHRMGLAHRHDGLFFYHRDGDHKFREILLTKDYSEALRFMGYAPAPFIEGFDSLVDIFEYVSSTEFFSVDIFLLENRNAKARVRDSKRPTYTKFLAWCEARPELPKFVFPEDKTQWQGPIEAYFPHFKAEYDRSLADLAELQAVKTKFNGDLVSAWTGLAGKQLGQVMAAWRKKFESTEALHQFVLGHEQEALQRDIVDLVGDLALA